MSEETKELLEFTEKRLDKNLEFVERRLDKKDEVLKERFAASDLRFAEVLQTTKDEIENLVTTIREEHQETRSLITERYHSFGFMMIILTGLLVGIYASVVLDTGDFRSIVGVILSIIIGLLAYSYFHNTPEPQKIQPISPLPPQEDVPEQ